MLMPPKAPMPNCSRMPASNPAAMPGGISRMAFSKYPDNPNATKAAAESR